MSLYVHKLLLNIFLSLFLFLVCQEIVAKTFVLGVIYSPNQNIAKCDYIIESVINNAKIKSGLDLKLIKLINHNDSTVSAFHLAKIAARMNVDAVIGIVSSEQAIVIANILNNEKIPFFAPTAGHPDIFKNKPYSIPLLGNMYATTVVFAQYMQHIIPEPKKLLIIRNLSMQYALYNSEAMTTLWKMQHPQVSIKYIDTINGNDDAAYLAEQVQKIKPDIIYLPIYSEQISAFLIALTKKPYPVNVFINGGPFAMAEAKYYKLILKSHSEIFFHIITSWQELSGPYLDEYIKIINTKYRNTQSREVKAIMTFDTIKLLTTNIKEYPNLRRLEFIKKIKANDFNGISGIIKFDDKGNAFREDKDIGFIITNSHNGNQFYNVCTKKYQKKMKLNGCIL